MSQTAYQTLIWSAAAILLTACVAPQARADAPASSSQLPFEVMEGEHIARTFCINCHVVDTNGPAIRTDRVPSFSWIANQKGLTPTTLPVWLSTSHERMPDFGLTRAEIRDLSAYISSLRK